jgi:hypothetical protein
MSKQTFREFITAYIEDQGSPDPCDAALIETIRECADEVWSDSYLEQHRWYSRQGIVVKLGDTYIKYGEYIITGDYGMSDMDLSYNIDKDFRIVERKERVITEFYYE